MTYFKIIGWKFIC